MLVLWVLCPSMKLEVYRFVHGIQRESVFVMADSRGGVNVVVRIRPLLASEPGESGSFAEDDRSIKLVVPGNKVSRGSGRFDKTHSYAFHRVHADATNADVYSHSVSPIVDHVVQGGSGACFAYGYTGTGKSTTVYGMGGAKSCQDPQWAGVAVFAAKQLLDEVSRLGKGYGLRVSMCEIAGKHCRDLLGEGAKLKVRTASNGHVYIRNENGGPLTQRFVRNVSEFYDVLIIGSKSRQVGSSTVHDESSRSHAVIEFDVATDEILQLEADLMTLEARATAEANERDAELKKRAEEAHAKGGLAAIGPGTEIGEALQKLGEYHTSLSAEVERARDTLIAAIARSEPIVRGRLTFVDMAGNDWEKATDVQTGIARAEQAAINTSLLAVKECLRAVAAESAAHVPFRRSVLTHLLQRHFVRDAQLLMIFTLSGSTDERLVRQSINTLNYAKLLCDATL